jgi:hypothetical protein
MSRELCEKCKEHYPRDSMLEVHVNTKDNESCFLCAACYVEWEKIYNKWRKRDCYNFWHKGWKEFIYGGVNRKFNPSLRDKYESADSIRPAQ